VGRVHPRAAQVRDLVGLVVVAVLLQVPAARAVVLLERFPVPEGLEAEVLGLDGTRDGFVRRAGERAALATLLRSTLSFHALNATPWSGTDRKFTEVAKRAPLQPRAYPLGSPLASWADPLMAPGSLPAYYRGATFLN